MNDISSIKIKIDLRPHYVFAFHSESSEFGIRHFLYYSRKDSSLHWKIKTSAFGDIVGINEDAEFSMSISSDCASQLERLFGLMIDAYNLYISKGNEYFVCDGSECIVICGKRRVRFYAPCPDGPLDDFSRLAYDLLNIKPSDSASLQEVLSGVPDAISSLEQYLSNPD